MIRKLTYLTLAALTWYLAGMYRSFPLTALFLAEIGIFILLAVQALSFYLTLDAGFPSEQSMGEKGRDCRCRAYLHQRGLLPIGRTRLTLWLSYGDGRQKTIRNIYGGVEGRRRTELEFFVSPAYCGTVSIELRQVRVYDYLSLFSFGRRSRQRMTLAVFPPPRPLRIVYLERADAGGAGIGELRAPLQAELSPETRGSREYRPGDAARSIHWKQSARTDSLWSREYELEADRRFSLSLDFSGGESAEQWDAFYEALSALILGLLQYAAAVHVQWRDGNQAVQWDVSGELERRELFLRLYHRRPGRAFPLPETDFSLDTALCWRRRTELLYRFSPDRFWEERDQEIFYI